MIRHDWTFWGEWKNFLLDKWYRLRYGTYYGACGTKRCIRCRPLFDRKNRIIKGTE